MSKITDEMVKEERRAYFRKWRSENRDKVRQHNANYWQRRVEKKMNGKIG